LSPDLWHKNPTTQRIATKPRCAWTIAVKRKINSTITPTLTVNIGPCGAFRTPWVRMSGRR